MPTPTTESSTAAGISALKTLSAQSDSLAVMLTYSCGLTFQFPDSFKAKRFPGLIFCGIIRNSSSTRVQCCWKSQSFCNVYEPLLRTQLSLAEPTWAGAVAQFETPQSPWWKRHSVSLGKSLLGLAALFGALSAIRDHFADLLAPPYVSAYISDSASVDYSEGSRFTLPVKIENLGRFGRANVTLSGASLRLKRDRSVAVPLQFDTQGAPQLAPGQTVEAHLLGETPTQEPGVVPQDYEVDLSVRATGGIFLGSQPVLFQTRTFKVWPNLAWKTTLHISPRSQQLAYLQVAIYSGRSLPSGARGFVLLHLPEKPESLGIRGEKVSHPINDPVKGSYKLEFTTSALQQFQIRTEEVFIAFTRNLTEAEWDAILSNARVKLEGNPV